MSLHREDFKGGDTEFGTFYPKGYVLSIFPEATLADRAVAALCAAGFAMDDLLVSTGDEVIAYAGALRAGRRLVSRVEHFFAGLYGDEPALADEFVRLAERGHTFVAIHAPDGAATARAAEAVHELEPVVLRKFDSLTFTDLR